MRLVAVSVIAVSAAVLQDVTANIQAAPALATLRLRKRLRPEPSSA
jgi:hypothetical protein